MQPNRATLQLQPLSTVLFYFFLMVRVASANNIGLIDAESNFEKKNNIGE